MDSGRYKSGGDAFLSVYIYTHTYVCVRAYVYIDPKRVVRRDAPRFSDPSSSAFRHGPSHKLPSYIIIIIIVSRIDRLSSVRNMSPSRTEPQWAQKRPPLVRCTPSSCRETAHERTHQHTRKSASESRVIFNFPKFRELFFFVKNNNFQVIISIITVTICYDI